MSFLSSWNSIWTLRKLEVSQCRDSDTKNVVCRRRNVFSAADGRASPCRWHNARHKPPALSYRRFIWIKEFLTIQHLIINETARNMTKRNIIQSVSSLLSIVTSHDVNRVLRFENISNNERALHF